MGIPLLVLSGNRQWVAKLPPVVGFVFMFVFVQTIFNKISSIVVGVAIAVGIATPTATHTFATATPTTTASAIVQTLVISSTTPASNTKRHEWSKSSIQTDDIKLTPKIISEQKGTTPKTTIVTLPSGAIVELDSGGNIIHIIREAPTPIYVSVPIQVQNSPIPKEVLPSTSSVEQALTASAPSPSKARIDIVSYINGKGLGRSYKMLPLGCTLAPNSRMNDFNCSYDESNYIVIGAVVYDDTGEALDTPTVEVTATDSEQNKTLKGTGEVTNIWRDGQKKQVPVYGYSYGFLTAGKHTITFAANGMSTSVDIEVK